MMILFSAFLFGLCNFHVLKQLSCTIESQIVILGSVMSALLWSIKLALEPWSSALNELAGYVEHCLWSGWRRIEGSPRPNNPITVPVHNTKPDYCPCTEEKKDFVICLDRKYYKKIAPKLRKVWLIIYFNQVFLETFSLYTFLFCLHCQNLYSNNQVLQVVRLL